MKTRILLFCAILGSLSAQAQLEKDTIPTSAGDLEITFIGHGSLMFGFAGKTIYVDPYSQLTDFSKLRRADLILLTHEHPDHLDPSAIKMIRTPQTTVLLTAACAETLAGGTVMKNGDRKTILGIAIEAVPAYNIIHMRPDGQPYHPRGLGNGYILSFGDKRVYVAGDTENTPEMKTLKGIDVAFLPMNLPYTMTPAMVADAAKTFRPRILYPYHFGTTDTTQLAALMKDTPAVEVRIRKMK